MTNLTDNLLNWYSQNKRSLPWRLEKKRQIPYNILISEIMLQQTSVNKVINYYKKFISKWPDIFYLSKAKLSTILLFWQGLGYYNRAINLHKTAKTLCNEYNGKIPKNYDSLIKLPGIGEYTANAILAIAYNKKTIGIDVNISRVMSRLYNLDPKNKKEIFKRTFNLLPEGKSSYLMQALMDIGAKICQKKKTNCVICPLKKYCNFYLKKKKINFAIVKRKRKFLFVYLIKYKNQIFLKKRKKTRFLNNLMEIPNNLFNKKISLEVARKKAPLKLNWEIISGKMNSNISNFNLEIKFFEAKTSKKIYLKNARWIDKKEIKKIPISTLMKNILVYLKAT